jgi:hypothetical protein
MSQRSMPCTNNSLSINLPATLQATNGLTTYYIGLALNSSTQQYDWLDGTSAGNGRVSNFNPYAHW